MSGAAELAFFLLGLIAFSIGSRYLDDVYSAIFLVLAGSGLFLIGPNSFLFGVFLASGWAVLSAAVDKAFPAE